MAIQTLNWCTCEKLDCDAVLPVGALLCVPLSIVQSGQLGINGIVIANITAVRPSTCTDPCGPCCFVYTITYDDAQLLPGQALVQSSVKSLVCDTCLFDSVIRLVQLFGVCTFNSPTINLVVDTARCITANVNISTDPNNCLSETASGLYVPCGSVNVLDTSTIDLSILAGVISGDIKLSADANNCLEVHADGLWVPCALDDFIQSISDTTTVDLDVTGANLTANVNISADANNAIETHVDGLYVAQTTALGLAVSDTPSIDMTLSAGPTISADAVISADIGNIISIHGDGLFVPSDFIQSITDTATVDLTVAANALSADVKISADAGNIVVAHADGVFAPTPASDFIQSVSDTSTIDLTVAANALSGAVKISADANNTISAHADGIYAADAVQTVSDTSTIDLTLAANALSGAVKLSADSSNLLEAHADGLWVPAQNGWIPFNVAATYISATSFSVPGDWTDRIKKSDKIKITDTTVKYFSVVSLSFGAGVTTFVITAGITYTLSGGALTLPFFSHAASPNAFPDFFTWTPALSATGAMTVTGVTIDQARFRLIESYLEYEISSRFTLGGTASSQINASLPCAVLGEVNAFVNFIATGFENGVASTLKFRSISTPEIVIFRQDGANFALGANAGFSILGRVPLA